MFQNISHDDEGNREYQENKRKIDLRSLFTINDIVLYAITFMASMVSFNGEFAPFGLAIFAAACSNKIPVAIIYIVAAIRNINWIWVKWASFIFPNIINIYSVDINI